jgi:NitT/TauT family transport system ATP-binding protein
MPKISVTDATKNYDTGSGLVQALHQVSLDVNEGEFLSIVGPSGCGKTTLLWAISGLHPLSSGEVRLDGHEVIGPRSQIGMMFQSANLLPWRNVRKNVELPFEITKRKPDRARIESLLTRVSLDGFAEKMPNELSGGMQQRAAIVRALVSDPEVLLMDEPFGALDAFTRDDMNLLVEKIWDETGKTIIFVTHSIPEAVFLSSSVYVMSARPGRITRRFDIPFARPRSLDIVETRDFFDLVNEIKAEIRHPSTAHV